jgi:uncharacterized protein (DUF433 family)
MGATLNLTSEVPPLRSDADGTVRVGKTRVILDLVIYAFIQGSAPEEIVEEYSTVRLADVYAVIGYYLHHRPEVDAYIDQRDWEAEELRKLIEASQPDLKDIRARLLVRRHQ